jgi:hypothetical protein
VLVQLKADNSFREKAGSCQVGFSFSYQKFCSFEPDRTPSFDSDSFLERVFVRCKVSVLNQQVLLPGNRSRLPSVGWELGQELAAVPLNSAVELGSFGSTSTPRCAPLCVAQWFIHFSAHPQLVQQHHQLGCHGNHRPPLGILSSALGQLSSPAPQIAVLSKGREWSAHLAASSEFSQIYSPRFLCSG